MEWTNQQKSAITSRNKNLLVAAAAGSGKTAVLVERIIQMILDDDLDVDKMLVVTFTNPAAQEMRSRIHSKIFERMSVETDSDKLLRLERQSILLSGASIMTFHAYCLSVLRRNFSKINFDPKFREGNEQELNILKQEVIEKLFEEKYSSDEDFAKFTDTFDGTVYSDKNLHELIFKLYDFSQSRPYPEKWLKSLANFYENPETTMLDDGQNWFDFLINFALINAQNIIESALKKCLHVRDISVAQFVENDYRKKWDKVIQLFEKDLKAFENFHQVYDSWEKIYDALKLPITFIKSPTDRLPDYLKETKAQLSKQRDKYKKDIGKLCELVYMNRADILKQIKKLAPSVRQLSQITIDFEREFTAAKRERGIIDFNDMEHLALKIFNTDSATVENYRKKFKVIMVDEYQDTNGVQEEIISKIVGKNNFFAVGDVKQSIYRFRNADPEIFMEKYDNYPHEKNSQRIDLSTNFRSRRQVVDAVNVIFRRLMTKDAMEIDYNEDAELNFGAEYPAATNIFNDSAEFLIINLQKESTTNSNDDDENFDDTSSEKKIDFEELDELGTEIQVIADKINAMISAQKKIWDKDLKIYRPVTYRDIVILMRAVDGRASKVIDVLQKNNIPAYAADNGGYFKAPEILTTLSLLNILDNARQDIPLAAVMLSPIGGFSEEDLATLRLTDKNADLYTLIKNFSSDEELSARCKNFLDKIKNWREMARQIGVPELLSKIYLETGYYDYFGTKIDGKIAQANLRMLIDRAAEFESTAFRGLSRFIQFIKKIRELENDFSAARTLGENENVVRMMSIHKSKGLEFPVVFVAQLGKRFNFLDLRGTVIAHRNLGVGIHEVQETIHGVVRTPTFVQKIIKLKMKAEILAEELRVLYVALTRAREKLFLIGTVKNENALNKYENDDEDVKLSIGQIQGVMKPIDWLLMIRKGIEKVIDVKVLKKSEIKFGNAEWKVEKQEISSPPEIAEDSPLAKIPAKLSVTEVKRRILETEEDSARLIELGKKKFDKAKLYRRPNFMQKTEITAAEFGTLMHSVMQHLKLDGTLDAKNISAQIDEMITAQIFTDEQGVAVKKNIANIEKFFAGDLGKRVRAAKEIYRELPFSQKIDAGSINAGENFQNAAGEKIFIQGIIDLLFKDVETGEWILLDYKTDRNNTDEHFKHEYKEQIRLYVQAIERLTSIKISEKYLYLLNAGRLIKL